MSTFNPGFDSSSVAQALGRLLGYLRTWQNKEGLFGGMIATWWSSTVETAVPHPMNQFPIIQGFLELHRGSVGGVDWLKEACRVGDGLVGSIEPDGMLKNCWGDIPGKSTGTVIFAGPALALAELYKDSNNEVYRDGAKTLLNTIEQRWSCRGLNTDGVVNQGFKWCEAMLAYGQVSGQKEYIDHAVWLGRKILDQQIDKGPMSGAFYQSRTDDRLISVYQGKCLLPLVRLYEESNDRGFLEAAIKLGRYVCRQQVDKGIFVNYFEPCGGLYRLMWHAFCRLDYRIFRRQVPVYRLWRPFIKSWSCINYPSFIARAADSILGLWLLSKYESEFRDRVISLVEKLIRFQLPHGGFPNTVGYCGDKNQVDWQDVCCPTRWNAYVFLLLGCLAKDVLQHEEIDEKQFPKSGFEERTGEGNSELFKECVDRVELYHEDKIVARIAKPSGENIFLAKGWEGDLTGHRGKKNLRI